MECRKKGSLLLNDVNNRKLPYPNKSCRDETCFNLHAVEVEVHYEYNILKRYPSYQPSLADYTV